MGIAREILLRGSRSRRLAEFCQNRRFVRRSMSRFMPGEDAGSAIEAAERLAEDGIASVLTYLGENVSDRAEADRVTAHYRDLVDRVDSDDLDLELSIKLTQLGLDLGDDVAISNLERILGSAAAVDRFVWIDMEGSEYTDRTLDVFRTLRREHGNVGVCVQAYLHRTEDDLEGLLPLRPAIRLVKGAYKEPPELAIQKKRDVDANYLALAERLLEAVGEEGARVAFGTHDLALVDGIAESAERRGVSRDGYEIQMLYGIRSEAQSRRARAGYRVRTLISYGDAWFPWFMRRLAERPANIGFVLRNLFRR